SGCLRRKIRVFAEGRRRKTDKKRGNEKKRGMDSGKQENFRSCWLYKRFTPCRGLRYDVTCIKRFLFRETDRKSPGKRRTNRLDGRRTDFFVGFVKTFVQLFVQPLHKPAARCSPLTADGHPAGARAAGSGPGEGAAGACARFWTRGTST